jgi:hypothetical protein
LCEHAYGYYELRYVRRYYNRTSGREEIVEITHPHTLLVVLRNNSMLDIFANQSECIPIREPPSAPTCPFEEVPTVCLSGWDIRFIKEFASMAVSYFGWIELGYLTVLFVLSVLLIRNASWILGGTGNHIEHLTLQGAMGFFSTAVEAASQNLPLPARKRHNDLYLSYSEAEDDQRKVHDEVLPFLRDRLGLKVCVRNHGKDVPAGQPEIRGVGRAIDKSKKAIVFLSASYLQDYFLSGMEAPMVVESFCSRAAGDGGPGSQDVLVVKLAPCEMPL